MIPDPDVTSDIDIKIVPHQSYEQDRAMTKRLAQMECTALQALTAGTSKSGQSNNSNHVLAMADALLLANSRVFGLVEQLGEALADRCISLSCIQTFTL